MKAVRGRGIWLCLAAVWLWQLLPLYMLETDALALAGVNAAALTLLKQKEERWIPLLAYPVRLRPLICRAILRDLFWWFMLTLPFLIGQTMSARWLLISLSLAGLAGAFLHQFLVPDGYYGALTVRINAAFVCTVFFLYEMAVNIRQWAGFDARITLLFLVVWLLCLLGALCFGPSRIRRKVQNTLMLTVFLKQRRELNELLRLRPDQTKDLYCRILQRLLPLRCVRLWCIAATLPVLVRRLFPYPIILLFAPLFPYLTPLVLTVFLVHFSLTVHALRRMCRRIYVISHSGH